MNESDNGEQRQGEAHQPLNEGSNAINSLTYRNGRSGNNNIKSVSELLNDIKDR